MTFFCLSNSKSPKQWVNSCLKFKFFSKDYYWNWSYLFDLFTNFWRIKSPATKFGSEKGSTIKHFFQKEFILSSLSWNWKCLTLSYNIQTSNSMNIWMKSIRKKIGLPLLMSFWLQLKSWYFFTIAKHSIAIYRMVKTLKIRKKPNE